MSLQIYIQDGFVAGDSLSGAALSAEPFIILDATIQEDYNFSAEATQHPVEEGSDITDNYRVNPFRYTVDGFVTNHPIDPPTTQAEGVFEVDKTFSWEVKSFQTPIIGFQVGGPGLIGAIGSSIAEGAGLNTRSATAKGYSTTFNRVGGVFDALRQLIQGKKIITIIAGLEFFENMVIEDFTPVRDASTGEALSFTAEIKQILIVASNTRSVPEPREPRGVPQSKDGPRPNRTPTTANQQKTLPLLTAG